LTLEGRHFCRKAPSPGKLAFSTRVAGFRLPALIGSRELSPTCDQSRVGGKGN
jgi:hypothetical protein